MSPVQPARSTPSRTLSWRALWPTCAARPPRSRTWTGACNAPRATPARGGRAGTKARLRKALSSR